MNEIAKCPRCGGQPLDKWEVTSVRVFQTGQTCCGVDCNTNERWNQYAAAMALAKTWLALEMSSESDSDLPARVNAHIDAQDKVRDAFGGER